MSPWMPRAKKKINSWWKRFLNSSRYGAVFPGRSLGSCLELVKTAWANGWFYQLIRRSKPYFRPVQSHLPSVPRHSGPVPRHFLLVQSHFQSVQRHFPAVQSHLRPVQRLCTDDPKLSGFAESFVTGAVFRAISAFCLSRSFVLPSKSVVVSIQPKKFRMPHSSSQAFFRELFLRSGDLPVAGRCHLNH